MPSTEDATSIVSLGDPEVVAAENALPVLFLHIPKTAGTSFLLMLQNTFGDYNVRRVPTIDKNAQSTIDEIVEHEFDQIACLTGHLPIHLFEKHLDRFKTFTMLREPVSRVLSLFRFLKMSDPAELRRLGLGLNCSLKEFLDSRHPEIYAQVNNGMVRLLCGDARMVDSDYQEFWNEVAPARALDLALANLRRIDFGLTEQMSQTLTLAQAKWSVPYPLQQFRENITAPSAAEEDVADLCQIIMANTLDLALYHQACAEFRKRLRSLSEQTPKSRKNLRSVFMPLMNKTIPVGEIAGRQGFHGTEPIGLAWLHADQIAEIQFVPKTDLIRLRLHLFCAIPNYPVNDIIVRVGHRCLRYDFIFKGERWGWLQTEYFQIPPGLNKASIEAPVFVDVADIDPGTLDKRRLGIALADAAVECR